MNIETLKEVAPHYIAMLILVFLITEGLQLAIGEIALWAELVLVTAIVFIYRLLVVRLGFAPSSWER